MVGYTDAVAPSPAPSPIATGRDFRPRLDSLTGLRFFAAFFVLQHHFTNFGLIPGLDRYTGFGTTGVTFFFVLSGFVLTWSFVPSDTAPRFYWRRFARIWPLHAVTTLLAIPVFYIWRHEPANVGGILLSFALLHAWVPAPSVYFAGNPASWSLSCEAFFYAVHPFIVRHVLKWRSMALFGAVGATLVVLYVVADLAIDWPARIAGWLLYVGPIYRIGEFLIGIGLAIALKRGFRSPIGVIPATFLLGAWFILYYNVGPHLSVSLQITLGVLRYASLPALYALIIAAAAQLDLEGAPSLLRSRVMIVLGQWSYALYLVQAIIIYAFIESLGTRPTSFMNVPWLVFMSAVCIAASGLLYHTVEHPLEGWLRGVQRARIAPATAAAPQPVVDATKV